MGVTRHMVALATRRPRCYLVEAPNGLPQRWAVERELDARGWRAMSTPAAADALVIAGELPPDLVGAAEVLWSQMPGPRTRTVVARPAEAGEALEECRRHLADDTSQRREARDRDRNAASQWLADDTEDMDHGDMEMAPGGISLAEGAEDRDGLEMDVLVHPLGPLLDRWPGGLELRVTLHGDVVADAHAHMWGNPRPALPLDQTDGWDAVANTLSLVGDERGARNARRLRAGAEDGLAVTAIETDRLRLRARLRRFGRWAVLPGPVVKVLLDLTSGGGDTGALRRPMLPTEFVLGHDLADVRLLIASHAPLLASDGRQHQEASSA